MTSEVEALNEQIDFVFWGRFRGYSNTMQNLGFDWLLILQLFWGYIDCVGKIILENFAAFQASTVCSSRRVGI